MVFNSRVQGKPEKSTPGDSRPCQLVSRPSEHEKQPSRQSRLSEDQRSGSDSLAYRRTRRRQGVMRGGVISSLLRIEGRTRRCRPEGTREREMKVYLLRRSQVLQLVLLRNCTLSAVSRHGIHGDETSRGMGGEREGRLGGSTGTRRSAYPELLQLLGEPLHDLLRVHREPGRGRRGVGRGRVGSSRGDTSAVRVKLTSEVARAAFFCFCAARKTPQREIESRLSALDSLKLPSSLAPRFFRSPLRDTPLPLE